jgi:hypothetical protein
MIEREPSLSWIIMAISVAGVNGFFAINHSGSRFNGWNQENVLSSYAQRRISAQGLRSGDSSLHSE